MTATTERPLADLVNALFQRERVSIAHVMRVGGLAFNTIRWLRIGRITRPGRETVQKLAKAFATDPTTNVLDIDKMTSYEGMLNAAAGYGDPTAEQAESLLELALYYRLQHLPKAHEWTRTIEALRELTIEEIRRLREPR